MQEFKSVIFGPIAVPSFTVFGKKNQAARFSRIYASEFNPMCKDLPISTGQAPRNFKNN